MSGADGGGGEGHDRGINVGGGEGAEASDGGIFSGDGLSDRYGGN